MEAAETHSSFIQLPEELLLKILQEVDDAGVMSCKQLSPFLEQAGVDILLLRHNIEDPSLYCEVQVIVPADLSRSPLPDALSALLMGTRRYPCIEHFHCTFRPLREYSCSRPSHDDEVSFKTFTTGDNSDGRALDNRMSYAFDRLGQLLSRVNSLQKVTIKVLDWTDFPDCFSTLLRYLIHTVISRGCSSLQVQCPDAPFGLQGWPSPAAMPPSRPTRLSIKDLLPALGRLFFSQRTSQPILNDLIVSSSPSSRVSSLDMDSALFHPSGSKWLSDLLTRSPLTEFAISLKPSTASYFTSHGLATLLKAARGLQSLTVLNATPEDVQNIAPRLRPFLAFKNLSICLVSSTLNTPSGFEGSATPFAPPNLRRLSISAALVSYMLLGTVTALNLKGFEIVYGKDDVYVPRDIVEEIASVRDYFDKISTPISIAIRLACPGFYHNDHGEAVSPFHRGSRTDPISASFLDIAEGIKAQNQEMLVHVDALCLELYPRMLRQLQPEDLNRMADLVGCFPGVRKVVLGYVSDFREATAKEATVLQEEVAKAIVQPIFAKCSGLASLWIGGEEFVRPLVDI